MSECRTYQLHARGEPVCSAFRDVDEQIEFQKLCERQRMKALDNNFAQHAEE